MRGFMCQSVEVTSGCTMPDPRSVIIPRKVPDGTLVDSAGPQSNARYARLVEARKPHHSMSKSSRSLVVHSDKRGHDMSTTSQIIQREFSLDSSDNVFQVVVMRVSLHCQGCAGKVKKHLSKMEGVTSFSIDLETKRVTVMGHVSPVDVLESISKVKRAEFWPS